MIESRLAKTNKESTRLKDSKNFFANLRHKLLEADSLLWVKLHTLGQAAYSSILSRLALFDIVGIPFVA
jgi:hypothetical protein